MVAEGRQRENRLFAANADVVTGTTPQSDEEALQPRRVALTAAQNKK
jgi:hypothetical protein